MAQAVGPLVEAATKVTVAEAELALEEERAERVKEARKERRRNGLYAEVACAVDRLHEVYGVTYYHWKAVSEQKLAAISDILTR